jgi:SAM-dependent methyltransferase
VSGVIRRTWTRLHDEAAERPERYPFLALQNLSHARDMRPLLARYARGDLLDVGAGRLYARPVLKQFCTRYVSCDVARTYPALDAVCDITQHIAFADESFDTIYCCSVLEHTEQPAAALAEMFRVLRPGGQAIVSVPFVFYLHGAPQDYFRFTRYGVELLAGRAGFEVAALRMHGGPAHTVLNVGSILTTVALTQLGLSVLIAPATRVWTAMARGLDRVLDRDGALANAILAVLRKPTGALT